MPMQLQVRMSDGTAILDVAGEIDAYSCIELKLKIVDLLEEDNTHIVLNLEEVYYIDSTGLGVIVFALKRVLEQKGRLAIIILDPKIKRLFRITGLDHIFNIYNDEADALDWVNIHKAP